jgi:hypothetical protein
MSLYVAIKQSCETAQLKHQKDNASQSDIIPALQGLVIYTMFFEFGCVERNHPPNCFRNRAILPQDEVLVDSGACEHFEMVWPSIRSVAGR